MNFWEYFSIFCYIFSFNFSVLIQGKLSNTVQIFNQIHTAWVTCVLMVHIFTLVTDNVNCFFFLYFRSEWLTKYVRRSLPKACCYHAEWTDVSSSDSLVTMVTFRHAVLPYRCQKNSIFVSLCYRIRSLINCCLHSTRDIETRQ